ncbi:MAG: ABC transporter permease [Cyclobacteriaceae bacterium]
MIKNYFLSAIRSLLKRKLFLLINVLGFSLGLSSAILMFAYVWDEIGFDTYHPEHERLYRIALTRHFPDRENSYATTPAAFASTLMNELPEVENTCRIFNPTNDSRVVLGDRTFYESRLFAADSTFFELFGVRMLEGNPGEVLKAPNSVVITQSMNEKYFGSSSGLNQTLEIGDTTKFTITGICEDVPKKSHFKFDLLISLHSLPIAQNTFWGAYSMHNYLKLRQEGMEEEISTKISSIAGINMAPQVESVLGKTFDEYVAAGNIHNYFLQPIQTIHLNSRLTNEFEPNGDLKYVILFFAVAILILAIACFNFTNLSTANSVNRSKEIGVRKVMGSTRKQLVLQFITESVIVTFIAVLLSFIIALLLLPAFNQLAGKDLSLNDFGIFDLFLFFSLLTIVVGIISGLYPAFFMSSFEIVRIFKGGVKLSNRKFGLRNILVTFQFAISILMALTTVFIVVQLNFMREKKLGFKKDKMVLLEVSNNLGAQYRSFIQEMGNQSQVEAVAAGYHVPGRQSGGGTFQAIGIPATERFLFSLFVTGYDFHKTYDMELVSGRYFDKQLAADTASVLINEACARMVGWDPQNAAGEQILITGQPAPLKIAGVLKDFHSTSLHEPIRPMVFIGIPEENFNAAQPQIISIRLSDNSRVESALEVIENMWAKYVPDEVIRYSFLDNEFDRLYESEKNFAALFKSFSAFAIIISSVGVIGLSFFIAVERVKEIGIRKVLGASVPQIMMTLSKDFLILAGIANFIIWPVAYLLIQKWMNGFAFSPGINLVYFLLIGIGFTLLVQLVVSFITFNAANRNPIDSISTE